VSEIDAEFGKLPINPAHDDFELRECTTELSVLRSFCEVCQVPDIYYSISA
jgi:hypothetical protein